MSVYDKVDKQRKVNGQLSVQEEAEVKRSELPVVVDGGLQQVRSRPSLVRTALLAAYEKQICFLEKVAAGEPFEYRTHVTVSTGGMKQANGRISRKIQTKTQRVETYTPTLDERVRAMEHLARFGLGSPNVNLDKDGNDAKPLVIKEVAE